MSELWLIAHKVRGEPALDVAITMECPECDTYGVAINAELTVCTECDGTGLWWIIPTSGHRAYPYWDYRLSDMYTEPKGPDGDYTAIVDLPLKVPPKGLPDHYPTRSAPTINAMEALLGSIAPARGGFRRRF